MRNTSRVTMTSPHSRLAVSYTLSYTFLLVRRWIRKMLPFSQVHTVRWCWRKDQIPAWMVQRAQSLLFTIFPPLQWLCWQASSRQGLHLIIYKSLISAYHRKNWASRQKSKQTRTRPPILAFSSSSVSGEMRKLTKLPILLSMQWQLASIHLTWTFNQTCDLGTHIC